MGWTGYCIALPSRWCCYIEAMPTIDDIRSVCLCPPLPPPLVRDELTALVATETAAGNPVASLITGMDLQDRRITLRYVVVVDRGGGGQGVPCIWCGLCVCMAG